jgi:hypothetical protein
LQQWAQFNPKRKRSNKRQKSAQKFLSDQYQQEQAILETLFVDENVGQSLSDLVPVTVEDSILPDDPPEETGAGSDAVVSIS